LEWDYIEKERGSQLKRWESYLGKMTWKDRGQQKTKPTHHRGRGVGGGGTGGGGGGGGTGREGWGLWGRGGGGGWREGGR